MNFEFFLSYKMQDEVEVALAPALPPMNQTFSLKTLEDEISYSQLQEFGSFPGFVPAFNHVS